VAILVYFWRDGLALILEKQRATRWPTSLIVVVLTWKKVCI